MLKYIIKRILLFVPTLVLVSMLAFGLSTLAEEDTTSALLTLKGIEPGIQGYEQTYERAYKLAKRDRPTFYLSLRPNYVKHNLNSIIDPTERAFVAAYAEERYSTDLPIQILSILHAEQLAGTLTGKQVRTWLIQRDMGEAVNALKAAGDRHLNLLELVSKMDQYRQPFHFPVLAWHGIDNQYHHWVTKLVSGNFGTSSIDGQSSASKIWSALRWTLFLLTINVFLTLAISIPYGLYTGLHLQSRFDRWTSSILFAIFAMPTFWIATVLVILFTTTEYGLKLFPGVGIWYQSGDTSFFQMIANKWTSLLLPMMIIVVKDLAYMGRMIRDTVAGEAKKLYVTTALAKGVSSRRLAYKHILPNALGPTITLAAGAIPGAFGGILLMEIIFNIPGMGRLLYASISAADWQVVYPIVLLTAVVTVFWYLVGDVLYAYLNPRITL